MGISPEVRTVKLALAWVLAVALAVAPAMSAQVRVEPQAALASRYVWRGITRSANWSFQPQIAAGWRRGRTAIDGGVFAAVELGESDPGQRSETGVGGGSVGEVNYWAAVTVYDGRTAIEAGVIRYTYHGESSTGGIASGSNTTELWAAADIRRNPFSPRIEAFLDVGRIDGLYLTGMAAAPVISWPLPPYWMVYVEAELGVNVGQEADPGAPNSGYFDDTGVTHARLAIRAPVLQRSGLTCALAYVAQLGFDLATRSGLEGDPSRGRLTHLFELRLAYLLAGDRP